MKKEILISILFPVFCFGQWTQVGNSINGQTAGDWCGYSTAISADGTIVAMGSNFYSVGGNSRGQVRVFGLLNGVWNQIGADLNGETTGDQTGQSVSLSADGSIVAIGEPINNDLGFTSGQVRVFRNINNTWTQVGQDLYGNNHSAFAGRSVDLSADGSVLAFGAPNTPVNGVQQYIGIVKVFQQQNNNWVQKGGDINGDGLIIKFGESVSLSADGNMIAIGQTGNPMNQNNIGRVKVYQFVNNQWVQRGSTISGIGGSDEFGKSVSLSSSGTILAIGSNAFQVKVYKFTFGGWQQLGNTLASESPGDYFGEHVSLSDDGNFLAIGAAENNIDGTKKGRTYIYKNQSGSWTLMSSPISGNAIGDLSGCSVAISQDGSKVAIGARGNNASAGQVRVFQNSSLSTVDFDSNSFSFYPNPSRDVVNFSSKNSIEDITLYNLLGQEVLTKQINSNEFSIDISNLSAGTYIAKLNNDKSQTVKLIKI